MKYNWQHKINKYADKISFKLLATKDHEDYEWLKTQLMLFMFQAELDDYTDDRTTNPKKTY